jgi:hypothetical protein
MKKPIIHAYFLCYNEANILPHLLRHYLSFCEKVFIMDNQSTDNSREIINSFENTEIIPYNSNNELRDDLYIHIKNNIWKNSENDADYVIVGDADEFLYHEDLVGFITEKFNEGYTIFKPEGYHMVADKEFILGYDDDLVGLVKQGIRLEVLDKMMIFNCKKIKEINYSFGCHFANPQGDVKVYQNSNFKMLHYKFLGIENYVYRNSLRRERLSDFNKKNGLGVYYLYSDDENIKDYEDHFNKRVNVID